MQISRHTRLLLFYGIFAVLTQLTFILLHIEIQSANLSPALLSHYYAPWLEYPLCSLSLVFGGSYLFEWIEKNEAYD